MIGLICCIITCIKMNAFNFHCFLAIFIVLLLMASANLINDVFDIKIDTINKPNRPLVKNPSFQKLFKLLALFFCFLAIFISFFINISIFLIVLISIPILFFYSFFFKKIALLGNLLVSFYIGLVFVFIEVAISNTITAMLLPAIIAFSISLIREIIKDAEDLIGDQLGHVHTIASYLGVKKTIYLTLLLIICFIIFCSIIMLYSYNFYYIIAVFFLVFMPLFYLTLFLIQNPTAESCAEASFLLKKITFLGMIIIYIL